MKFANRLLLVLALVVVSLVTTNSYAQNWQYSKGVAGNRFKTAWEHRIQGWDSHHLVEDYYDDWSTWWYSNSTYYDFSTQTTVYGKLSNSGSKLADSESAMNAGDSEIENGVDWWILAEDATKPAFVRALYYDAAADAFESADDWYDASYLTHSAQAEGYLDQADDAVSGDGPEKPETTESTPPTLDPAPPQSLMNELND